MTEQNGIDILCDAAGPDLLLSSLLSPSAAAEAQGQQPPQKKLKRSSNVDAAHTPPSTSHLCHICKRVYERADHLTRHLRSHENARPYQCTRCPKRFNRADLLTRHEATHDRDDGRSKPLIKRSDRATQACEACATAKAKCDDQKPCGRCQAKKLPCSTPRRGYQYKTYTQDAASDSAAAASVVTDAHPVGHVSFSENVPTPHFIPEYLDDGAAAMVHPMQDDMVYLNPMQNLFQDIDFQMPWDMNFDAFTIPQLDIQGPSPQSSIATTTNTKTSRNAHRDLSRGHAAFKRSPWLWEPKKEDYVLQEKEGLHVDEQSISQSPAFGRLMNKPSRKLRMNPHQRDRIFSIVLAQNKDSAKVPAFPTLDLLNYLLQAHFVQDEYQLDSWIHAPSFDPEATMPELLASIISSGATFISVPAIWQFGLAMQEVVRIGMSSQFESRNASTRDLRALQAFMLCLDVGMWSGFKRKMEIAESFCQPLLTMLRRAGAFSTPADSPSLIPLESDSAEILEGKWQKFVIRESYKRLILRLFTHDVQTSISLQKNPLISYTELSFSLPASRDLWRAPTAEAWRQTYLSKSDNIHRPLPRVNEVMHCVNILDDLSNLVDLELCYSALLHGFWGQIAAYRESIRFYATATGRSNHDTHHLWLRSQHQQLYHELCGFSTILHTSSSSGLHAIQHLALFLELLLMILHVSLDELQRFAGKSGEDEARRAAAALENTWIATPEARHAVWHAGQVLLSARRLPPASLRGFNAIAVYLASLTLWAFGLLSATPSATPPPQQQDEEEEEQQEQQQQQQQPDQGDYYLQAGQPHPSRVRTSANRGGGGTAKFVLLDAEETRDTKAFLQFDRGVPALTTSGGAVESLAHPTAVLSIARGIFRESFPVRSEPLPPLVESLGNLLRDLGSGLAGLSSRIPSRPVSRMASEER